MGLNPKATETEVAAPVASAAGRHVSRNEGLIFEKSAPGKRGMEIPPLDVPSVDVAAALGQQFLRDSIEGFPEVSEIEVIPTSRVYRAGTTRLTSACIRSAPAR